jgi:hypothetical protein
MWQAKNMSASCLLPSGHLTPPAAPAIILQYQTVSALAQTCKAMQCFPFR